MTDEPKDVKTSTEMVRVGSADIIPNTANMEKLAKYLLDGGMFPNYRNLASIITVVEYGRELGIPPAAALNTMFVVNGKLAMEAKAMLSVAHNRAGVTWEVVEMNDNKCRMKFMRDGFKEAVESEFTYKEAQDAKLTGKDNWIKYRQDMLFARCASRGIRRIAPDAVLGIYSKEEMLDVEPIKNDERKPPLPADAVVVDKEPLRDEPVAPQGEEQPVPEQEPAKKKPGRPTNKFKALEEFGKIKKEMGSAYYYTVLRRFGVDHANLLPEDKMREVYAELLKVQKQVKESFGATPKKDEDNGEEKLF